MAEFRIDGCILTSCCDFDMCKLKNVMKALSFWWQATTAKIGSKARYKAVGEIMQCSDSPDSYLAVSGVPLGRNSIWKM